MSAFTYMTILGITLAWTIPMSAASSNGIQFEFASYQVAEDAGSVLIGVLRGDAGNDPVTVDYATTNVTAIAGEDYLEASGTLTFAAGEKLNETQTGLPGTPTATSGCSARTGNRSSCLTPCRTSPSLSKPHPVQC
jgi:FlaG/FlaF family flagellin (archaellin)